MESVKFSTITADNVSQWLSPVYEQTAYTRFLRMVQAFSTDGFLLQTDRDAFNQKIHSKMQPLVDIVFDVKFSPAVHTDENNQETSSAASIGVAASICTLAQRFDTLQTTLDGNQKALQAT